MDLHSIGKWGSYTPDDAFDLDDYEFEDSSLMDTGQFGMYLQPADNFTNIGRQQNNYHFFGESKQIKEEPYQEISGHEYFVPVKSEPISVPHYHSMQTFVHPPSQQHHGGQGQLKVELSAVDIQIDGQPPVEVRTRTPSEIRTFGVTARVTGPYRQVGASLMNVALYYAATDNLRAEPVPKDILGGSKTVPILADGSVVFDSLSICESSTKHKEREFCLEFILLRNDGQELMRKRSRAFYAYSHKKVLQRRGSVKLRTLSKSWGRMTGGESMHVIGSPFIQGPAISLIFRTPNGDVFAKPLEYYSDSVLFFELPPYPVPEGMAISPDTEIRVVVLVTNDGRTYSNPLEFTYIADSNRR